MNNKTLALVLGTGLLLSACSEGTTTNDGGSAVQETAVDEQDVPRSSSESSEPAAEKPAAEEPAAEEPESDPDVAPEDEPAEEAGTVAWGKTYTSPTKRKIVSGVPQPWTPNEYAITEGGWKKYVKVTLTLVNDANEPFDSSELTAAGTSGDRATEPVFDDSVGTPDRTVLPGRKLSFDLAFGYEPGAPLTVELSTFDGPIVTFDGVVR
ncbi:hypothetical protein [Demetria terragena]|uniref:hypothetical protein n=1 Tax=Demetria terragena TaxID=63959 RepID=UPI00037E96AA|nr:hypothetical protein [Demetria terragena]